MDLYSTPTDKHQYLYYSSCHPKHTKTSLPYSLALRLRRIYSNETLFQKCIEKMQSHLLQRGYKRGCIKDAIKKATSTSRDYALKESNDPQLMNRIPFVVTYNPIQIYTKSLKIFNLASVPLKDVLKPFQTPLSLATDVQET